METSRRGGLFVGFILAAALAASQAAAQTFDLWLSVNHSDPVVGEEFYVDIHVVNCPSFKTAQCFLAFDPACVATPTVNNFQELGDLTATQLLLADSSYADGVVFVGSAWMPAGEAPGGDGTLYRAWFKASQVGIVTISTEVFDGNPLGDVVLDSLSQPNVPALVDPWQLTINIQAPTPVVMTSARARAVGLGALVEWTTESELDNAGFDIVRRRAGAGAWTRATARPIPGRITAAGAERYRWLDIIGPGTYEYRVETISTAGVRERHGSSDLMTVTVRRDHVPGALGGLPGPLAARGRDILADLRSSLRSGRAGGRLGGVPRASRGPGDRIDPPPVRVLRSVREGLPTATAPSGPGPRVGDVRVATRGDGIFLVPTTELPCELSRAALLRGGRRFRPLWASGDGIVFFAPGVGGPYTDLNATFVRTGGSCGPRPARPARRLAGSVPIVRVARATARSERDAMYAVGAKGAPDPWLQGPYLTERSPEEVVDLHVPGLVGSSRARLRVAVYGYTSDPGADPDHALAVTVNGEPAGRFAWDGRGYRVLEVPLAAGHLGEGANTVGLVVPEEPGIPSGHGVIPDYVEVEYDRSLALDGGDLVLEPGARCTLEVAVRPGQRARAIEIDPLGDARGLDVRPAGGPLRFDAREGAIYFVTSELRSPEGIYPARVAHVPAGTDYLAVGPEGLRDAAGPLLGLREAEGLAARYISLGEAADTFGWGLYGAKAVRGLVRSVRPRYVLLVGDNTYDYLDREGTGVDPMVPSVLVPTRVLAEANADALFGDLDGDDVPDVPVGRLPVRTAEELELVTERIASRAAAGSRPWGVLLADGADGAGDFPAAQAAVARECPSIDWTELYLGVHGDGVEIRTRLAKCVGAGADLVVYQGHGAPGRLASGARLLDEAEAAEWSGDPLVCLATCWSGLIFRSTEEPSCIAEVLVRSGGASGVVVSTTPSTHRSQSALVEDFVRGLAGGELTAGEALLAAERAAAERAGGASTPGGREDFLDTVRCYVLLGDPAMRPFGPGR